MIFKMYTVRDKLTGFTGPVSFKEDKVAVRWFKQILAEKKANYEEPKDFELYEIGTFNNEKGIITGMAAQEVKLIEKGENLYE